MRKSWSDGSAMALGSAGGFVFGIALGGIFSLILGEMPLWLKGVLLLHTAVAMTVMGAWSIPCLMPSKE